MEVETKQKAILLCGCFGKDIYEQFLIKAKYDYKNNKNLSLKYDRDVIKGSNVFDVVLVNQLIEEDFLNVAKQRDLEKILKTKSLNIEGYYLNSSILLKNEENPNSYLAKNLISQIKRRNPRYEMPVMINLSELELVNDYDSNYGLAFNLKENSEIISSPILKERYCIFSSEDVNLETGLAEKFGVGERTFEAIDSGLSVLYLHNKLDLLSSGFLSFSTDNGRIIIVRS